MCKTLIMKWRSHDNRPSETLSLVLSSVFFLLYAQTLTCESHRHDSRTREKDEEEDRDGNQRRTDEMFVQAFRPRLFSREMERRGGCVEWMRDG